MTSNLSSFPDLVNKSIQKIHLMKHKNHMISEGGMMKRKSGEISAVKAPPEKKTKKIVYRKYANRA